MNNGKSNGEAARKARPSPILDRETVAIGGHEYSAEYPPDELNKLAARFVQDRGVDINGNGPCPACGLESIYSRAEDRYLHVDGSDNKRCWAHISSGCIEDGPLPPPSALDFLDNVQVPGRKVVVTRGSAITPRRIEWWETDIIVKGEINLLAARENSGKSTLAAAWAARETQAGGTVLWVGTEESREYAQVPRLIAAGADMGRVVFVDIDPTGAAAILGALQFPLDLPHIEDVIRRHQVTMIVLDPCKGLVPSDFKGNDDVAVRQYLEPIGALCNRTGVTLIGLAHFGKRDSRDPGKLLLGSIAWSQVARSVISVAEDPDTDTRVLTNTKANYSSQARSIEFRIVSQAIDTADGPAFMGAVEWIGDTAKDARQLLGEPHRADDPEEFDEHDYTADLKQSWLYRYLDDARKDQAQVRPKDAVALAADKGISRRTVFRLFETLANAGMAESVDSPGFPRVTHWRLAGDTTGPVMEPGDTTGTTGHDLQKQAGTTAELFDQAGTTAETPSDKAEQSSDSPVVPVVPSDSHDTPLGGITAETPGMTDRVKAILAKKPQQTQEGEVDAWPTTSRPQALIAGDDGYGLYPGDMT
ncbi:AAA family ATPase [Mycobacterium sp. CVI_P3]|nr:AAA family ATPase [Mycobacterium pinniadriaticum]MCX2929270.1 AAA family ATPase [Mycobacterium pinniadriaticum]